MNVYAHIPWTGASFLEHNDKLMFFTSVTVLWKSSTPSFLYVTIFADKFHLLKFSSLLSVVRCSLIQAFQEHVTDMFPQNAKVDSKLLFQYTNSP